MEDEESEKRSSEPKPTIDLASPVLFCERSNRDDGSSKEVFVTPSSPPVKKPEKRGRKRLYGKGYSSVEPSLRGAIKLELGLHTRWQCLRGTKSHNQFAEILMNVYESLTDDERIEFERSSGKKTTL